MDGRWDDAHMIREYKAKAQIQVNPCGARFSRWVQAAGHLPTPLPPGAPPPMLGFAAPPPPPPPGAPPIGIVALPAVAAPPPAGPGFSFAPPGPSRDVQISRVGAERDFCQFLIDFWCPKGTQKSTKIDQKIDAILVSFFGTTF